jgi:ArsR family transcriptional regulator
MALAIPRRRHRPPSARRDKDLPWNLAGLARALEHPARIRIVRTLIEKKACIGCARPVSSTRSQSTVSEHLRILKAAGIITGEIERPRVCYSLNPTALEPLREFLLTAVSPGRFRSSGRA